MLVLLAFLVAGVVLGLALGGGFRNLGSVRVRWWPLAIVAVALQVIPWPSSWGGVAVVAFVASYALLLVVVYVNLAQRGFALILFGVVMNLIVITANQGMPVSGRALRHAGGTPSTFERLREDRKHHLAGRDDVFLALADVIPLPPLREVVSLGDLLSYAGAAWFLSAAMLGRPSRRRRGTFPRPSTTTSEAQP